MIARGYCLEVDLVNREKYKNFFSYLIIGRYYLGAKRKNAILFYQLFFLVTPWVLMRHGATYLDVFIPSVMFLFNLIVIFSSFFAYYSKLILENDELYISFKGRKFYSSKISNIVDIFQLSWGDKNFKVVYGGGINGIHYTIFHNHLPRELEEIRKSLQVKDRSKFKKD